ncbi:MAG: dual specificity protein phosphatase family protein [Polyangiaceae bacterium]|nr:dual specificity protein phosphatase family protein [Polyangiaceae bacterium]
MWLIDERLWLGDYRSGRAALSGTRQPVGATGSKQPFSGVVSLCPMPLFSDDDLSGPAETLTEWLKLPIADGGNGEREFELALQIALPFIERRQLSGNVLVHCAAGMSRSVSVIAAVLCARGLAPGVAYEMIATRKAEALGPFVDHDLLIAPAREFRATLDRLFGRRGAV